jgi:tetratricopeptide (TPR) repeat protein
MRSRLGDIAGQRANPEAMRLFALIAALVVAAAPSQAQREFVEEVQPTWPRSGDVDLDAPDPALSPAQPAPSPAPTPIPASAPTSPAPAKPQPTKPQPTKPLPPPPPATDGPGASFTVVPTSRAAFLEKVAPHFTAVLRDDAARARKALSGVQQGALEAAVAGLPEGFAAPAVARALVREARRAVDADRSDDATELVDLALWLAPSDLDTILGAARVRLDASGLTAALSMSGEAMAALVADPVDRGNAMARALATLIGAVLLTLVVVVATVAVPSLPIVAFDLGTRLPRGVHQAQLVGFVLIVAVAPLLLGFGAVVGLLWMSVLAMIGIDNHRRLVIGLVATATLALPMLVDALGRAWTVARTPVATLHRALYDIDGDDAVAALLAREAAGAPIDAWALAAIANAARREGRIDEAVTRYKELVRKHGEHSWVHGGYAVALATARQPELALVELGLAIERARLEPGGAVVVGPAAFNASLLHHAAGRTEKAQSMLASVTELGPDTLARLRRATFRAIDEVVSHNRAFAEVLPPRQSLPSVEGDPAADAFATTMGTALWGSPPASAWPRLGGLVGLVLIVGVVASRIPTARSCGRCGAPASSRVDGPGVPVGTCAACYHAFMSPTSRVDGAVRLRKENAIRRRGARRARLIVLLSLWPGAGHLFAGAAARGAALSVGAGLAGVGALVVSDLWPGPGVADLPAGVTVALPALVWAVLLAVAVRGALTIADDERGGLR